MRLTCPICGAQYDVPAGAIPPDGRDVQCSACGHTWFEPPAGAEPEPEPWDQVPHVAEGDEEADDLADAEAALPSPVPGRSTVTPGVAEILRAEAARESQVRAEDAARAAVPVIEQPLAPPPAPPPEEKKPAAPPLAEPPPQLVPEPQRSPTRPARPAEREMDLDQINASLRAANRRIPGRAPQIGEQPQPRRAGFASGFWGALLLLGVLAGLYLAAPAILDAWPGMGVVLNPYVAAVDELRLWLDRQVAALLGTGGDAPPE